MVPSNPFRPSFGTLPPVIAGRDHVLNEIDRGLGGGAGHANRSMILIGPRGTGKTVLLESSERRARTRGWSIIRVSASKEPGLINSLMASAKSQIDEELGFWRRIRAVRAAGFGLTLRDQPGAEANLELLLDNLGERCRKKKSGLLITVDELHDGEAHEARHLGNVLQLEQSGKPHRLLGSGPAVTGEAPFDG